MTLRTLPYDTAEFLDTEEDVALFAEAVLDDGDPEQFRAALDVIVRAYGLVRLAARAGLPGQDVLSALRDHDEPAAADTAKAMLRAVSLGRTREAAE